MKLKAYSFFLTLAAVSMMLAPKHALAQDTFEGTIHYSVGIPAMGDDKMAMSTNIKGQKVEIDMDLGAMGGQHIYMDKASHTLTIIMDGMKTGYSMDIPAETDSTVDDGSTLTATGKTDNINGYKAEEYLATSKGVNMDLWVTADLPANVREAMVNTVKNNPQSGKMKALRGLVAKGLAPIRTTIVKGDQTVATVDLVKIEPKSLSDAIFTPPSNITVTKMDPKMMGGMH